MKQIQEMSLQVDKDKLIILDQSALPKEEIWIHIKSPYDLAQAIQGLKVRGAPLIGVTAAISLALYASEYGINQELIKASHILINARPTAVNLAWAVNKIISLTDPAQMTAQAELIYDENVLLCDKMGQNGKHLINNGDNILTHCNTGSLATGGKGTALSVITSAFEEGKKFHVYANETRPLMQGARLTIYELNKVGIPNTLICDHMGASLMRAKKIDKIFVGADRIAINGDFANKIGTYNVAVAAHYHNIPFYVVAPYSTIDRSCASGDQIPIELRDEDEVRGKIAPNAKVYNPSFDVTPVQLVTGYILDKRYVSTKEITKGAIWFT